MSSYLFFFSFIILFIYSCIIFSGKPTGLFDWYKISCWLVGYCQLLSAATKRDLWQINFGFTFQKSFPKFILVTYKYFGGLFVATLFWRVFFIALFEAIISLFTTKIYLLTILRQKKNWPVYVCICYTRTFVLKDTSHLCFW